jgi:hypothetical protein
MHAFAPGMQYDRARLEFYAIAYLQRIVADREGNKDAVRRKRYMRDTRQIFLTAEQAQMAQLDPSKPSLEIPLGTKDKIKLWFANARLVVIGVEEFGRAAPLHSPLPRRPGESKYDP